MPDFHNLRLEFENIIVVFEISVLEFVLLQRYVAFNLIWVFLDQKLKIILSYVKSAPSSLSNCKTKKIENALIWEQK